MNTKVIDLLQQRRLIAAREAIKIAGGPTKLAARLNEHLRLGPQRAVSRERIAKWRYQGIPVEWGVIVEHVVPTVQRAALNPWAYTTDQQLINSPDVVKILRI